MARVYPKYSKNKVDVAGAALRDDHLTFELEDVVDNWRASHATVLNVFRQTINRHTSGKPVIVAQRLKRLPTIADKLRRFDGMQLSRMQDIAGCRLIFPDVSTLRTHRETFLNSRFKHELRNDRDAYDYIKSPKVSGYRGIHDVYRYRSFSGAAELSKWDGLQIEIQYRTQVQHAWATAVEVHDAIRHSRTKFSEGVEMEERYFRLASELLARRREGIRATLTDMSDWDLSVEMVSINSKIRILQNLNGIVAGQFDLASFGIRPRSFAVLVQDEASGTLTAIPANGNLRDVTEKYFEVERANVGKNVVLVFSSSAPDTRSAYRNYFRDVGDFTKMVVDCQQEVLEEQE